jgi:hypothetical protein
VQIRSDRLMGLDILTPLGFSVTCTRARWQFIVSYKHPVLAGREKEIEATLSDPNEVRRSRKDATFSSSTREVLAAGSVLS